MTRRCVKRRLAPGVLAFAFSFISHMKATSGMYGNGHVSMRLLLTKLSDRDNRCLNFDEGNCSLLCAACLEVRVLLSRGGVIGKLSVLDNFFLRRVKRIFFFCVFPYRK